MGEIRALMDRYAYLKDLATRIENREYILCDNASDGPSVFLEGCELSPEEKDIVGLIQAAAERLVLRAEELAETASKHASPEVRDLPPN